MISSGLLIRLSVAIDRNHSPNRLYAKIEGDGEGEKAEAEEETEGKGRRREERGGRNR